MWLIVSTILKTIGLTPVIVFMAYIGYAFLGSQDLIYKIGLFLIASIGIVSLLTVFVVDTVRNKRNYTKKIGWLSYFFSLGIPMIWFAVAPILFFNVVTARVLRPTDAIIILFVAYIIGVLCFLVAFISDRLRKRSRVTTFDHPLYSTYVVIPLIWFVVSTILALVSLFSPQVFDLF